ncbi:MAG: ABC transporter permease, partial [Magnetospirillum sp.]|nr:ABC transporter permease [Magnetospirillum sp.]
MTALAVAYARRELRGGIKGFRILVACLALGVAAIAAAGSLKAAFNRALDEDGRAMLGGDLELRQSYQPFTAEQRAALAEMGAVSGGLDLRAMAFGAEGRRHLVELKGVDGLYPLVGVLDLDPVQSAASALERRDGEWGAAVDANLLATLGLRVGDSVTVGEARLRLRATLAKEPARGATALAVGPRLLLADEPTGNLDGATGRA